MCRNIRTLFNFEPPVTEEEIRAASLQFVRKVSGFNKPSKANEAAFLAAVDEIAGVSRKVITMHDVEGYSLEELETMLETPLGTLKSRLHRARQRLRALLPMEPFRPRRRVS